MNFGSSLLLLLVIFWGFCSQTQRAQTHTRVVTNNGVYMYKTHTGVYMFKTHTGAFSEQVYKIPINNYTTHVYKHVTNIKQWQHLNISMVPDLVFDHFPSLINILNALKYKFQSIGLHKSDQPFKLALFYISFLVIMQSGDLHPNPGPYQPKFPCVICTRAAKWNQRAVCCDQCEGWYHVSCMNMNTIVYESLANSSVTWVCCQCGMPNFSDSMFSNSDIALSNSFSSLSSDTGDDTITSVNDSSRSPPLASSSPKGDKGTPGVKNPTSKRKAKPKRSNVKVLVINFQGIRGKFADIVCCIDLHKPDIIVGTESHIDSSVKDSELFPPDYQVIRKDRDFGPKGGVLIAVKNDLIVTHRIDLDSNCEIVWVSISIQGMKKIIIGAFYRSQQFGKSIDYMERLKESLSKIKRVDRSHIWLAGDFNLPGIDWASQSVLPNAPYVNLSKFMLEIAADFGLEQMVTRPTRGKNILDIFLTNNPDLVERSTVIPGLSDHDGIPMIIVSSKPRLIKTKPRLIYLYDKADMNLIKEDFKSYSSHMAKDDTSHLSVNDLWEDLENKVKSVMEARIPTRTVRKRNLTPWIGRGIKRLLKKKQRAFNSYKKEANQDSLDRFHMLRKATQKQTRKSYRKYINSICMESSKKFWSFMKGLRCDSIGIPTLKSNGILESDNLAKADILNHQFKSVFTLEKETLPSMGVSKTPSMPDISINIEGVIKLLKNLDSHKAPGPDGVPARILKEAAEEIAPALCTIFEKSLETGELPSSWLCANISPIFKKGDRTIASNYRPISLTAIACKILEHILHSNIMHHFDKFSVLTSKQHGFRKHHSCESQLILTSHDLARSLNSKAQIDMIIMDFTKAFDTVPHNRLLLKLDHYGVRNKTYTWIANFLKCRKQRVVVGGEHSAWTDVVSGVPQGTVLGPLLFLVYINDLPNNIRSIVRLFADDCVIYRQILNQFDHDQLQDDLFTLERWQKDWQLHFNIKKCFVMRITHKHKPDLTKYTLGGSDLDETKCHAYLGVDITNTLSWNNHIHRITSSANKQLGFIRRNLYSCTKELKQTAYTSLVRPLVEYSSSVWDPHQANLINKIEMVQRRAARFVMNDYKRDSSVTKMIKDLDWCSLKDRRTANRLTNLQKARHGLLPLPVDDLLQPLRRPSRHSHSNAYQLISANKDCFKHSYIPKTIIDWNNLPLHITTITDPNLFKHQVLNHLKQLD